MKPWRHIIVGPRAHALTPIVQDEQGWRELATMADVSRWIDISPPDAVRQRARRARKPRH